MNSLAAISTDPKMIRSRFRERSSTTASTAATWEDVADVVITARSVILRVSYPEIKRSAQLWLQELAPSELRVAHQTTHMDLLWRLPMTLLDQAMRALAPNLPQTHWQQVRTLWPKDGRTSAKVWILGTEGEPATSATFVASGESGIFRHEHQAQDRAGGPRIRCGVFRSPPQGQ